MQILAAVVICVAFTAGFAFAETPAPVSPLPRSSTVEKPRSLDVYLSQNLVRIAEVRYTKATDAVAALKRNRIVMVRVLICPLTHRENVDKLIDALVAAELSVSQAKIVESREYRCADNARVETRIGA